MEIKTDTHHYFIDDATTLINGKYRSQYPNGIPHILCYYEFGVIHGEYKCFSDNGTLLMHMLFLKNSDIINLIAKAEIDIFELKLKYDVEWIE